MSVLDAVLARLLDEPERWPALLAVDGAQDFAEALVAYADEGGLTLEPTAVITALDEARRAWLERWV